FTFSFARTFRCASYERAKEPAELAEFSAQGMALIDYRFGLIDEERAEDVFRKAAAEDIAAEERELAARKARLQARRLKRRDDPQQERALLS
ncbi:MAG: hypothetical protein JXA90_13370, partial [Planctomycetes bacterium]|nr:hypothetical protein [Planctomycetota bacterium]